MTFQTTDPLVQISKSYQLCLRPSSLERESYIKDMEQEAVLHQCPGQGQRELKYKCRGSFLLPATTGVSQRDKCKRKRSHATDAWYSVLEELYCTALKGECDKICLDMIRLITVLCCTVTMKHTYWKQKAYVHNSSKINVNNSTQPTYLSLSHLITLAIFFFLI